MADAFSAKLVFICAYNIFKQKGINQFVIKGHVARVFGFDNYVYIVVVYVDKRTTAGGYLRSPNGGNINGDYPVLAFDLFGADSVTCLGSSDGIRIDYATSLKEMLHRHNNGNMNENTVMPATTAEWYHGNARFNYAVTESPTIYKGTINLYRNDDVTLQQAGGKEGVDDNCTAEGVKLYIDEDA